ncbi:MAG: helix-turn-helix transcriptional regulator [Gammaproteobacteria bacterium]|nr:helix-turn-helix transcriptional regulator [Gammaproteobacteria bacterium]
MTRQIEKEELLTFNSLYHSTILNVRNYLCRACQGGPAAEEYSDSNNIVLMRHGVFCKHIGRRSVTVDVNQAVFFSKRSTYRVSHPADCGDRGTVFTPAPHLLTDIIRELDPSIDDRPDEPFPFIISPCDSSVFWRHREIVLRLESTRTDVLDSLWVDVTALQLIADVLQAAFVRRSLPRVRRRNGTDADHADRVEAAKIYLANHLCERVTLDNVACAVHASPYHFARMFQMRTGVPVHRYLMQLRLRASLERLADGASDLAALALDLGFSSHSHFTDAFGREFGRSPSSIRRNASRRTLCKMSKNLKV